MGALIRYYFKVDPYELSEEQFRSMSAEVLWLNQFVFKQHSSSIKNAIVELYNNSSKNG